MRNLSSIAKHVVKSILCSITTIRRTARTLITSFRTLQFICEEHLPLSLLSGLEYGVAILSEGRQPVRAVTHQSRADRATVREHKLYFPFRSKFSNASNSMMSVAISSNLNSATSPSW